MLTDPVADMLTRIRNANKALHDRVEMPSSKLKEEIARILQEEGYIRGFHVDDQSAHKVLVIELKYGRSRERVLTGLKRVSKPGRRIYANKKRLPRVLVRHGPCAIGDRRVRIAAVARPAFVREHEERVDGRRADDRLVENRVREVGRLGKEVSHLYFGIVAGLDVAVDFHDVVLVDQSRTV